MSSLRQNRACILGSHISTFDLPETVQALRTLAEESRQTRQSYYVCVANVHTVVEGMYNPSLQNVMNASALATADGVPLSWASKILKQPKIRGRAAGPDILDTILRQSFTVTHYFYGSTPAVLEAIKKNVATHYPVAKIVGFYSPPFRSLVTTPLNDTAFDLNAAEQAELDAIMAEKPDFIWVGLGAPKQELFIAKASRYCNGKYGGVFLGVGAAFDFLAGTKKRAPVWMQKVGLEWLFRLMSEPRRLAARYFRTNPLFILGVAKQMIREYR